MYTTEILLQVAILTLTLATFVAIHYLSKDALTKHRTKNRTSTRTNRHLLQGTHLLSRARSTPHSHQATLAKTALQEAEAAAALSPRDPSPLILKATALQIMGRNASALRAMDQALSTPRVSSLAGRERGDALVRRAELKLAVNRRRRVDSAVEDLEEAVGLVGGEEEEGKAKAFCLLGGCYEFKGKRDEARRAFHEALEVEPGLTVARLGLDRLGSS